MSNEQLISIPPNSPSTSEETSQIQEDSPDSQTGEPEITRRVLRNNRIIEIGNTREGQYKCPQCDRSFSLPSSLLYHQQDVHEDEGEPLTKPPPIRPRYQCDICERTFSTKKNVTRHKETVHERLRPYECDVCHQSFGTRYTLSQHKKARHRPPGTPRIVVRRHACPVCGKMFTTKGNVAYHQRRVHEHLMPFPCEICHRRFGCKAHLVRHERCVHQQLKLFRCEECGKQFGDKGSLNEHVACIHSDELPYRCPQCFRRYATARGLRSHQIGVHTNQRQHQCADCNKAYKRPQALIRHRMLVHGKGVFYPCSDCDARCLGPVSLQHHRRTFHGKSDVNRFSSELPKVEQLIGGEPIDMCEWNLEQMQRELEENHFIEDSLLSSDSDTEDASDTDSERTLPLSDYDDDELIQETHASDPVGWVIEIDTSNATEAPDELEITRAIVPSYLGLDGAMPTLNGPNSVRRRITFVEDDSHKERRSAADRSSTSDWRRFKAARSLLAGRRMASLKLDKNNVYQLMHTRPCSHPDTSNWASISERDIQPVCTENGFFVVKPSANFKLMRKHLGLFHLMKIARAPTKRRLPVQCRKRLKVDSIVEKLARNLAATAMSSELPLPQVQEQELLSSAAIVPEGTT